jgi:hypothetical protein
LKKLKVPIAFYVLLILCNKAFLFILNGLKGAAFNVTFLALLLTLVYPLTMVLKQQ